jgi:hypothetical protein
VVHVRENGQLVATMQFASIYGQPRIITSHDTISMLDETLRYSGSLFPVVRHQDGSQVGEQSPARPGEALSMWAVGLAYCNPLLEGCPVKTGAASPPGITPLPGLGIRFDFGFMLPPQRTVWVEGQPRPTEGLLWVGLVPGQVGVSQINFRVPSELPPGLPQCVGQRGGNLTVSIGYYEAPDFGVYRNVDGASICVEVPKAASAAAR